MTNTKNQQITIIVDQEYRAIIEAKVKSAQLNISAYVRRCLEYYDDKSTKDPIRSRYPPNILQERIASRDHQLSVKDEQLATKDQQIEHLQSALDQSQQLQALAESRHQAEQQQLAEMRARSVLQRLRAVFVAD